MAEESNIKCRDLDCDRPATHRVLGVTGEPLFFCEGHAEQSHSLLNAIGRDGGLAPMKPPAKDEKATEGGE